MAVTTTDEVETAIGRPLTTEEEAFVELLIPELTAVIELYLNRKVEQETVVEEAQAHQDGRLFLSYGPIASITTITYPGETGPVALDSAAFTYEHRWLYVPWANAPYTVTYVAGDEPVNPAVKILVRNAIARTVLQGPVVGSGAISSYSVEGTAITYSRVSEGSTGVPGGGQPVGKFTVADITSIQRLQRLSYA